jgi:hypothetical protein
MKIKFLLLLILLASSLSLVSCSPSEEAIQVALAQTQTAMATNTHTPDPTATFTPEPIFTSTPKPTFTPTPTQTHTLTPTPDLRVITIDSKDLMLSKDDLPAEAKYYLPNSSWISPHHNYEIVSAWGREEGLAYLEETGRIDGWFVYYKRGTDTIRAPEEIYQNIIQYQSAEGAYITFSKYNNLIRFPDKYKMLNENILIGDSTIVYMWKEMQSNGENRVNYYVESQYRNYLSIVGGWGWEKEFDLDYVIKVAEIAIDKIMAAPLGNW